ncbi:hypothetical protein F5X96DRAFT_599395 [Biscogniauxia mediterranea]|nr:hypothetical protein F5X96DRAFT_599395 [Biscogniauxia mediterranea]
MSSRRVAIISGGASGIGLALAESLSLKDWAVHIFDLSQEKGEAAAHRISATAFHQVDVNSWQSLSSAFENVFRAEKRLDFVFANAGVMEKGGFYARHDTGSPPPPPDESCIDVNLKGIVRTAYLAQHYFRGNADGTAKDRVLVMTSSVAGIYPQDITPLYAATKAGIINFMRSVAGPFFKNDGIRTYAICPGSVRTNLLSKELWDAYPQNYLTSMDNVTATVNNLIRGGKMEDSNGKIVDLDVENGLAVEVFVDDVYFRGPPSPCNDGMRFIMEYMSNAK